LKSKIKNSLVVGALLITSSLVNIANAGLVRNGLEFYTVENITGETFMTRTATTITSNHATKSQMDQLLDDMFYDSFYDLDANEYHDISNHVDLEILSFFMRGSYFSGPWVLPDVEPALYDSGLLGARHMSSLIFNDGVIENPQYLSDPLAPISAIDTGLIAYSFTMFNRDEFHIMKPSDNGIVSRHLHGVGTDVRNDLHTHVLVRSVPESSSIAIFALGLLGLISRRLLKLPVRN